ncbi:MAG: hypothetical protein IKH99_01615 [Prevotella sp.]|nr:hypothetical protein [Prevotella sp.]
MYKIRFMPYRESLAPIMHRQTKGHSLRSLDGRYQFFLDEQCEEPDFWVVQGKGVRHDQTCRVAPENTIMLTTEPRSVLVYPEKYLRQFGLVCTCQEQTRHPHVHFGPAILPWFVGYTEEKDGTCRYTLDYDTLCQSSAPHDKTKLISVITSNKAFTRGHLDRIRFVEKLKEHFGDHLEIFGRGFRDFEDKWDVLRPYKYHIVIENSSERYYWTEKISDCMLAETFPFYYGCTHLEDYFPKQSFLPIDIRQPEQAISRIDEAISTNRYEQSVDALAESKRRVLNEYNMFEYVARLCDTLNPEAPKKEVTIHPCHSGLAWENFINYTFKRHYYETLTKIHYQIHGNALRK